jgi:hypothetical protein
MERFDINHGALQNSDGAPGPESLPAPCEDTQKPLQQILSAGDRGKYCPEGQNKDRRAGTVLFQIVPGDAAQQSNPARAARLERSDSFTLDQLILGR